MQLFFFKYSPCAIWININYKTGGIVLSKTGRWVEGKGFISSWGWEDVNPPQGGFGAKAQSGHGTTPSAEQI